MSFEVITREDAKRKGLKRYFSGNPCKYGHVCERLVSNNNCITCRKQRQQSEEGKAVLKKSIKKYQQSEKGKTSLKKSQEKYFKSEKGKTSLKKSQEKYFKSEKGKDAMGRAAKKFFSSDRGKLLLKNYRQSEKGKAIRKKANRKYQQSEKGKKWIKNKLDNDPAFKMASRQRMRISEILGKKGIHKEGKTLKLIGCSAKFLSNYIQSKFKPGMSWDNYGVYGWHVDHIKPLSKFNLQDPEEQKKAFHYLNLQPLWAKENIKKKDKY